jgi:undecaprenyl pyrophosphate synthase
VVNTAVPAIVTTSSKINLLLKVNVMSNEKKSNVKEIMDANKELATKTFEKTQEVAEKTVDYIEDQASSAKDKIVEAFDKVSDNFAKISEKVSDIVANPSSSLEGIFDTRVARAIKRLGTPTADVLISITEQLTEISAKLRELGENATDKVAAPKKPAAKKPAAKKPVTEKPAAKKPE